MNMNMIARTWCKYETLVEIELEKDLVKRHEDYWDSGRNFYCKIPIVGNLFKFFHK